MHRSRDSSRSGSVTSSSSSSGTGGWKDELDGAVLGAGAFGVVWSATDIGDGQPVAVKKLTNIFESLSTTRRVYRELCALTQLQHTNILSAKSFLLMPSKHSFKNVYVITDLFQTDLQRIITSPQPISNSHIQLFLYQILRGLRYLHSAKIIHRDIKPGNLLVNVDCRLRICDLGLACDESDATLTAGDGPTGGEGQGRCGTLTYSAPELLLDQAAYDATVDVWAAGCVLGEMLIRRPLFPATTCMQQLDLIIEMLGAPANIDDFRCVPDAARRYLHSKMTSHASRGLPLVHSLLCTADQRVLPLLTKMLAFSPTQRISASQALAQRYVMAGRYHYHSTLCSCCDHKKIQLQHHQHHPHPHHQHQHNPYQQHTAREDLAINNHMEPECHEAVSLSDAGLTTTNEYRQRIRDMCLKKSSDSKAVCDKPKRLHRDHNDTN